jgi:Protein prenyltransferase alpha subunit repeat
VSQYGKVLTYLADPRLPFFLGLPANFLIEKDPRNNSAWNQRWFVCHRGGSVKTLSFETAKREADYAIQGAGLDPYNESPWRYLIGILKEQCKVSEDKDSLLDEYEKKAAGLRHILEKEGKDPDGCSSLTSARIDILDFKGDSSSLEKVSCIPKSKALVLCSARNVCEA